jgi:predicted DCC family thiol-disulfide oxidoreductase YuxK
MQKSAGFFPNRVSSTAKSSFVSDSVGTSCRLKSSFSERVIDFFGADLRSLGVLRIAIALIILCDLVQRSGDLVAHYTDFGVLPRNAMIGNVSSRWLVSIHLVNGTWEVQAILFGIAGLFALLLLVGYKTRTVTIASWFLFTSLCVRNTVILAGDFLLSALLFWAIFLPWGARFSLDKALHPAWDTSPERCVSWGTAAYVMQMVFVFWFGALMKSGAEWRVEGSAIYYALSIDQLATSIGLFLLQFPTVLKVVTFGVLWLEVLGPLLLFSPIWTGPLRTGVVFVLFVMFLGFGLCLDIGILVWTAALGLLGLLPSCFWEKINLWRSSPAKRQITIYYDQDCGFCTTFIRLTKGSLKNGTALILPAQTEPSIESDVRFHNSWLVVDENGNQQFGLRAGVAIAKQSYLLRLFVPLLEFSWIERIREKIYALVTRHRKVAYNLDPLLTRNPVPAFRLGKSQGTFVALLLLYVFFWNLATIPNSGYRISERLRSIGEFLGLAQAWTMFTPSPLKDDGWYVIPGKLKNGREVDLFRDGKEISWAKPLLVSATYKNFRWQKYMMNLWSNDYRQYRPYYAQYLCWDWNSRHASELRLEELQIYFLLELTLPNYEYSTPEKVLLLRYRCRETTARGTEQ